MYKMRKNLINYKKPTKFNKHNNFKSYCKDVKKFKRKTKKKISYKN